MSRVETLVDQQPWVGPQQSQVELGDVLEHQARAGRLQRITMTGAVDTDDQRETPAVGGLNAGHGVLHHHRPSRPNPETARRLEEHRRVRLAVKTEVARQATIDHHVEQAL